MKTKQELSQLAKSRLLARKLLAEKTAENNLLLALQNPAFSELYKKGKHLVFELGKAQHQNQPTASLTKELTEANKKAASLLKQIGLTNTDLKPKYVCKVCNDQGVKNGNTCKCYRQELSAAMLLESGLSLETLPKFSNINFTVFSSKIRNEITSCYKLLEDFSNKIGSSKKCVVTLSGDSGVGKTYLTKCVCQNAIQNGAYTIFVTAFMLNNDMLKYHCAPMQEKNDILAPYLTCDLLVIDDLGSENILNNVTREYLYLLINDRMQNNRSTLITTNLDMVKIRDVYDERIFSRLTDREKSIKLNFPGQDLRNGLNEKEQA